LGVLEDLLLLLLRAVKVFILLRVLRDSVARGGHFEASTADFLPVDILEEGVALDLCSPASTCTEALAWVTVEQVHDQVLRLL